MTQKNMINKLNLSYAKMFRWLLALFVLMYLFRLAYGYMYPGTNNESFGIGPQSFSSGSGSGNNKMRNNYASEKLKEPVNTQPSGGQPGPTGATQKYEKVATLQSKSSQFEADEQAARGKIKSYEAVIQYEQNSGNTGHRHLQWMIGVRPERFDSFCTDLLRIGRILSRQVTKTDKTNEFLELNAKRVSLEKTRASLLELKRKGGQIDEFIGLENRILEIEGELQGLGVKLGDYDEENEFCTVLFSLQERAEQKISLFTRLKVAFEWTVTYYAMLMLCLLIASIALWLLTQSLDRMGGGQKG